MFRHFWRKGLKKMRSGWNADETEFLEAVLIFNRNAAQ